MESTIEYSLTKIKKLCVVVLLFSLKLYITIPLNILPFRDTEMR